MESRSRPGTSRWDVWTGQHDYSWGPGGIVYDSFQTTTITPGVAQRRNGADRYFWTDSRGSTRHLTSTGNTITQSRWYDAFGNQANTTGTDGRGTDFLFAGAWGYQTEYNWGTEPGIGLQYLEQRYYDPVVGRFLTPDPIGWAGGLNLYGYVGNDPVNWVDPSGLCKWCPYVPTARQRPTYVSNYTIQHNLKASARAGIPYRAPLGLTPGHIAINSLARKASLEWFKLHVKNSGSWDYKQADRCLQDAGRMGALKGDRVEVVLGIDPEWTNEYADFGNWHYGAVAYAFGLDRLTAQRMAGVAQGVAGTSRGEGDAGGNQYSILLGIPGGQWPFGDAPEDQNRILHGYEWARNHFRR